MDTFFLFSYYCRFILQCAKIFLLPKHKNQLTILYYKTVDTLKHIVYNIHITWFECDVKFDFGRIMAFV